MDLKLNCSVMIFVPFWLGRNYQYDPAHRPISVGPYDFRNAENADGITESRHKHGIYFITQNVAEFAKFWMN